jgi:hypothetical protein
LFVITFQRAAIEPLAKSDFSDHTLDHAFYLL